MIYKKGSIGTTRHPQNMRFDVNVLSDVLWFRVLIVFIAIIIFTQDSFSQFTVNVELLQRAEVLKGFGNPAKDTREPDFLVGQKARLEFRLKKEKYHIYMAVQDIRRWGTNPSVALTDNFIGIHEAWGEFNLSKNFSLKTGRQELDFDNNRFLGNVDWALQARSHDAIMFKMNYDKISGEAGFAYNFQMKDVFGMPNSLTNSYKIAQFLRLESKIKNFAISGIFWNNGVVYETMNPDSTISESYKYMQTFGLPNISYTIKGFTLAASVYYQLGTDKNNRPMNAYNIGIDANYTHVFNDSLKNRISVSVGADLLSGTSQIDSANTRNNSYSPLFGTNHRHNGYMDYFYVGGRHENSVGLHDFYVRLKYDFSTRGFISLNQHFFRAAAAIYDKNSTPGNVQTLSGNLGYEIDLAGGFVINDAFSLQAGYSMMYAMESLKKLRSLETAMDINHWGYVMLIIRPGKQRKFTGLKF